MFLRRPARLAAVCLGLSMGLGSPALAGEIFHHGCDTKKVKLPAQYVELQVSAPSVAVRERVTRSVVPAIGTLYMPLAAPIVPLGVPAAGVSREIEDYNPLARVHEAERYQLNYERARAALRAEMDASSRALSRMMPASASESRETPRACDSDVDKRLKEVNDRLDRLNERITAVEKLLIIHDNYLQQQGGARSAPREAPGGEQLGPPKPMMPLTPPIRGTETEPMGVEPKVPLVPPIK